MVIDGSITASGKNYVGQYLKVEYFLHLKANLELLKVQYFNHRIQDWMIKMILLVMFRIH